MLEMLCRDTLLYNYVIKIINNKKLYYNYNYKKIFYGGA